MDKHHTDLRRRQVLKVVTAGMGGVGLTVAAAPFVKSMSPSERAKAAGAPVEVDLSEVSSGALVTVEWRGRPVWVVHRTPKMLALLKEHEDYLADPHSRQAQQPHYVDNETRSITPSYFIAVGICTHLGCVPVFRPEPATSAELGEQWHGGFYCPCHGSKFDLAGRVYKNVPAPLNLEIPPHMYLSESRVLIGEDGQLA